MDRRGRDEVQSEPTLQEQGGISGAGRAMTNMEVLPKE